MPGLVAFWRTHRHQLPLALGAIFRIRCRVALVRGTLRNSDQMVTLLYAGRLRSRTWLLNLAFSSWQEITGLERNVFTFRSAHRALIPRADAEVLDMGWPWDALARRGRRYLQIPAWISMRMSLPRDPEALQWRLGATLRRKELPRIHRAGFCCEVSRDPALVRAFYDTLYLPAVRHRHGDGAVIASHRLVQRRARRGWLLRVMQDDRVAAAGVFYPQGDTCHFLWMGTADGFDGAATALYWFGLQHAIAQGYRHADFGGTRALLSDGALRFKRKWGAQCEDSDDPGAVQLAACNDSVAAWRFLAALPALVRTRDGLQAWLVAGPDAATTDQTLLQLLRAQGPAALGVTQATMLASAPGACTQFPPGPAGCQYRIVRTRRGNFARHYPAQGEDVNATAAAIDAYPGSRLIDWPAGQTLPGVVRCRHNLQDTGLFTDEALLEVFDRHDPDELLVYRMGEDHHRLDDFQYGSRGNLTARQLLDAVKAGRLWLNIIHITQLPTYRELVDRIYDELEAKVKGFRAVVRSANLLVSSPGAKVYYHADAPLNMLWHLRGEKRVWIYPDGEKYAPREWVEMLFTRESDDDLPYRPEFDQDATAHALHPGDMLTWPQNRPHRVENVQGLCVSLTTEHYTPEAMKKRMTYLANRYLRQWLRLPATGTRLDGPRAVAKRSLFRIARRMPWWHEAREGGDTAKFTLQR